MKLLNGDCIVEMQKMIDEGVQVDSVVTDPPYELGFMGKSWDSTGIAFQKETWELAFQLLKPGGHLLAFGGSRTYHRMAVAIEDAGFDIRDQIMWLYGSGFPKSLNVSKAIDKTADYKIQSKLRRDVVQSVIDAGFELPGRSITDWTKEDHAPGKKWWNQFLEWLPTLSDENQDRIHRKFLSKGYSGKTAFWNIEGGMGDFEITAPATPEAKQWEGWGTALKPAHEPVVLARKPLAENTVAENVLKHGTGGINIDECRIEGGERDARENNTSYGISRIGEENDIRGNKAIGKTSLGRFPANVMHDGSEEVLKEFSNTKSIKGKPRTATIKNQTRLNNSQEVFVNNEYEDEGSAARFFYCSKVSKNERNRGLDNAPEISKNHHPTVKPIELMKYLCRLVTPKGGTVLDPFMGSGSTGMAAKDEGFEFIGIEKEKEYFEIAKQRIDTTSPLLEFIR